MSITICRLKTMHNENLFFFTLSALVMGKDTIFWMITVRISEEWKIASPCQNDSDLICSILTYEVCTRSFLFILWLQLQKCSYQTLLIFNNMKFIHQIYVYGGNGLNAQFVTFVFNNNHCLDFLLVAKKEWWVQPTEPASSAVEFLWIAGVLDSCWTLKEKGFSESVSRNGTASTAHRIVQLLSHTGQLW